MDWATGVLSSVWIGALPARFAPQMAQENGESSSHGQPWRLSQQQQLPQPLQTVHELSVLHPQRESQQRHSDLDATPQHSGNLV